MAGIAKNPGPTARRLAANIKHTRRKGDVTTAELSRRLAELKQPIPDTGITKTEAGTRRVDADDLVAISLALGVTPNTLLMPPVGYLGSSEVHELTPAVSGSAEKLWQWAQGEAPLPVTVPGSRDWLGGGKWLDLEFSLRSRPYLAAPSYTPPGDAHPMLYEVANAIVCALAAGAHPLALRRTVELVIALPETERRKQITRIRKGDGK